VPTQVIQVAPFPLMIVTLALVHGRRTEPVQRWSAGRPRLQGVLAAAAPRALGKGMPHG
jgi:simple sugar transport system permease protein